MHQFWPCFFKDLPGYPNNYVNILNVKKIIEICSTWVQENFPAEVNNNQDFVLISLIYYI